MKSKTRRIRRKTRKTGHRGGVTFSNTVPVRMYNIAARPVMNANNNSSSVSATVGPTNNVPPYMNIGAMALKPEATQYGPFLPAKNETTILGRMRERLPYPYETQNAHLAAEYAYYSNNIPTARRTLAKKLKLRNLNPLEQKEYEELMNKAEVQGFRKTIMETMNSNILPPVSKKPIIDYLRALKIVKNAKKLTR